VFLYGVGCSEGYSGVGVFKYFGFLLCSMSKVCQCDTFALFVGFSFVVIMFRYAVVFVLWICLFGIGSVVVCTLLYSFLCSCGCFPWDMC
jgi:hypothetical protein